MATMKFGNVEENVITRDEWSLDKARQTLKGETLAVLGYGVQGPGQALNLKDNGFEVIVGQRKGGASWEKALADGWVEGKTLYSLEEAASKGSILMYLLSDAGQLNAWPMVSTRILPIRNLVSVRLKARPHQSLALEDF